jgi:hypothetical protein
MEEVEVELDRVEGERQEEQVIDIFRISQIKAALGDEKYKLFVGIVKQFKSGAIPLQQVMVATCMNERRRLPSHSLVSLEACRTIAPVRDGRGMHQYSPFHHILAGEWPGRANVCSQPGPARRVSKVEHAVGGSAGPGSTSTSTSTSTNCSTCTIVCAALVTGRSILIRSCS